MHARPSKWNMLLIPAHVSPTCNRPKRRHLVISDWVDACVAEETLLDEEGKQAFYLSFTPLLTMIQRIQPVNTDVHVD